MALFDWLFKSKRASVVKLDLDRLMAQIPNMAVTLVEQRVDPALQRARVADMCRQIDRRPLSSEGYRALLGDIDEAARRRLWIATELARDEAASPVLTKLFPKDDVLELLHDGLMGTVEATAPVTMKLLVESPLRVEEFARHFIARLGADVEDETREDAQARLERLDYRTLLEEADRAKASAEERLEYLRQLQSDLEARRRPRGKW